MPAIKMNGVVVKDASRNLSTEITAADVSRAIPTDPAHCAIAESMRRSKGVATVSVGASKVYVTFANDPDTVVRYDLSKNDRALIKEFDVQGAFPCGYKVKLTPPPASRKLGARAGVKPGSNKRSGKGKTALHRATRTAPTRHVATPA
jgi:hypothetical protein